MEKARLNIDKLIEESLADKQLIDQMKNTI
jgi:hypothetical protein